MKKKEIEPSGNPLVDEIRSLNNLIIPTKTAAIYVSFYKFLCIFIRKKRYRTLI